MTEVGERAADFTLPAADGKPHGLDPAPATVVYFASNRCPSCRSWQPRLADAARDYAEHLVRFFAVNVPCQFPGTMPDGLTTAVDSLEGMREAVQRPEWQGITYLYDASLEVARAYGARVLPDVFVLDSARVVRYRGAPDGGVFEPEQGARWLRGALDAVLARRTPEFVPDTLVGSPIKWRRALSSDHSGTS